MLRSLAIVPLLLLVLGMQGHAKTQDTKQATNGDHPSPATAPVIPQQANRPALQDKNKGHIDADVRVISSPAKDRYDKAAFWVNIALVGVGIGGIIVAGITLLKIERQTKATEIASEAAARSTAAYINKERSRLFIRNKISANFEVAFRAANWGKSPARITYGFVGCELFKTTEKFREIPQYDNGEDPRHYAQDEWIPENKARWIGSYDASYVSIADNPELYESVMSGELRLWFYGVVRYRDSVSEEEHEVRFCYRSFVRRDGKHFLLADGPAAYRLET
jgi:hypothetical protein